MSLDEAQLCLSQNWQAYAACIDALHWCCHAVMQGDIAWNTGNDRVYGLVDGYDKAILQGSNKDGEVRNVP